METATTRIVSVGGKEYNIPKRAVAKINPKNCVNCGKCRAICPVEAISEQQRVICRICPSCTSQPALTFDEMVSLATEKACTTACPLGISPQGYINLVRIGKDTEAYQLIWDKCPLPSICGRICHHPCEQACKRGILVDEPIAIRATKRYLTDNIDFVPEKYPEIYEERIAVIGAGPAGLTAAHYLSMEGFPVTVFDSEAEAGGMMLRGIPPFRLPREVIAKDIDRLVQAGMEIRLGEHIGKFQMEELLKDYDAVIVATGAPKSKELKIDGWQKEGVMTALDFMERINHGQEIWRHPGQEFKLDGEVVVIGGGNVAIDSARTAVRIGAQKVTAVCLEMDENVPCHSWDLAEAEEEGVTLLEGWAPQRFTGLHNTLTGVEFEKVTKFGKGSDGKLVVKTDPSETKTLKADWVIVAIGQGRDSLWSGFKGNENIFFAGDVERTECSVVDAMADGRKTALQIAAKLEGHPIKDPLDLRKLNEADINEKIYPAVRLKITRPEMPVADPGERAKNFDEVEGAYTSDIIDTEVLRCLQCGYQEVDTDKCIGCGVCKSVCPVGDVITMDAIGKGAEQ
ncbi:FAD-dependent oxidoreductase [Caproiciproducens sp.]